MIFSFNLSDYIVTDSNFLDCLVKTVISTPLPSEIRATKALKKILSCGVTKDPSVTVHFTWEKDKVKVSDPRMSILDNGSLLIATVLDVDAGTYVCTVRSIVGNDTTSGTLIVQGMKIYRCLLHYLSVPVVANLYTCDLIAF